MKPLLLALLLTTLLSLTTPALAQEYQVRPFLIDEVLEPRESVTKTVVLTNNSEHRRYIVFATVNEITVDTAGEIKSFVPPVRSDRSITLTSWIEVTRGRISVPPGEQREVPLTIKVSPQAEPGEYHAFIGFVPAANRPVAEQTAMRGEADGVILKVTISDQRKDSLRLSNFDVDRFVLGEENRTVKLELENLGDLSTAPEGEIILYNSRGEEIAAVPVNPEGYVIDPGERETLTANLPEEGLLGKLKANLVLEYGENQRGSIQDTMFFYVIPWYLILLLALAILVLSIVMTILFRRVFIGDRAYEDTEEVAMFVKDGHDAIPQDHDIDLKNNQ